jgi:hypothetical protein
MAIDGTGGVAGIGWARLIKGDEVITIGEGITAGGT